MYITPTADICSNCQQTNRAFYPQLGICKNCYCTEWRKKNPTKYEKQKERRRAYDKLYSFTKSRRLNGQFAQLKRRAKSRKVLCTLSESEYLELRKNKCFYCTQELNPTGVGLDRIDSLKGYEAGNVVPCCKYCNLMKNDLTTKQFFSRIEQIYKHHQENL